MLPPNLAKLTDLLSTYQEAARAADLAADKLMGQSIKLERHASQGKTPCPGVLLYRQPTVVQAREAYARAANQEEAAYFAWLAELADFMGRPWETRVEIREQDGLFVVVERDGQSFVPVYHRSHPDGTPGERVAFHSRHEAVFWVHHRAVAMRKGAQGAA